MSPPVFQDNASIPDEERLFRRVHVRLLVRDDDTGLVRVSSGAFRDPELSVDIESVLTAAKASAEACLQNYKACRLVSITAGEARRFNQAICRDPLPENLFHGLVYGLKNRRSVHDGLRAAAAWVIPSIAPSFEEIETEKRKLGIGS
jgi:hypothetical protein